MINATRPGIEMVGLGVGRVLPSFLHVLINSFHFGIDSLSLFSKFYRKSIDLVYPLGEKLHEADFKSRRPV